MPILDEHFAKLQEAMAGRKFGRAELTDIGNGTALVKLADFVLPPGWNSRTTTVYFLVPAGYPVARPDNFWTDRNLSLASGAPPANTGTNQLPGVPQGLLLFSWHPNVWDPNRDTLVNYVGMIWSRFDQKR